MRALFVMFVIGSMYLTVGAIEYASLLEMLIAN